MAYEVKVPCPATMLAPSCPPEPRNWQSEAVRRYIWPSSFRLTRMGARAGHMLTFHQASIFEGL